MIISLWYKTGKNINSNINNLVNYILGFLVESEYFNQLHVLFLSANASSAYLRHVHICGTSRKQAGSCYHSNSQASFLSLLQLKKKRSSLSWYRQTTNNYYGLQKWHPGSFRSLYHGISSKSFLRVLCFCHSVCRSHLFQSLIQCLFPVEPKPGEMCHYCVLTLELGALLSSMTSEHKAPWERSRRLSSFTSDLFEVLFICWFPKLCEPCKCVECLLLIVTEN